MLDLIAPHIGIYIILVLLAGILLRLLYTGVVFLIQIVKGYGVPNVTTHTEIIDTLLKTLDLHSGDYFIDLGAGEGKIVAAVSEQFPHVTCIGYEFAPSTYKKSQVSTGLDNQILNQDFFTADLSPATHIYCYLMPHLMGKVRNKVSTTCSPGTKLYVNAFPIPNLLPTETVHISQGKRFSKTLYVYEISETNQQ